MYVTPPQKYEGPRPLLKQIYLSDKSVRMKKIKNCPNYPKIGYLPQIFRQCAWCPQILMTLWAT